MTADPNITTIRDALKWSSAEDIAKFDQAEDALDAVERELADLRAKAAESGTLLGRTANERDDWQDRADDAERRLREATDALRELLEDAKRVFTAGLTVKPYLDSPYPDDDRWTPWTRFLRPALVRLDESRVKARRALAAVEGTAATPGDDRHIAVGDRVRVVATGETGSVVDSRSRGNGNGTFRTHAVQTDSGEGPRWYADRELQPAVSAEPRETTT